MARSRPNRSEKLARIYDAEILPVWAERFGRLLLRDLGLPDRCQILDVACGTGYPAVEIVRRMAAGSRLIAIDSSSAMIDVARRKMQDLGIKGVFFRTENVDTRMPFADDVYDLVLCNLGLGEMSEPGRALAEFARVAKPGGEVRCSLPIEGTFQEFFDIYREVLTKHDKHDLLGRLDEHIAEVYPTAAQCDEWLRAAGLDGELELERWSLLFRSSREFFFAPVIEYGPLPEWKELAGRGQEMQDVFWYIKEAIDAYFEDRAFEVSVVAARLRGVKRARFPRAASEIDFGERASSEADFGDLATDGGELEVDSADIAGEEAAEKTDPGAPRPAHPVFGADDIDVDFDPDDRLPTTRMPDDVPLDDADDGPIAGGIDALVEGKPRPSHLDDE